MNRSLSQPRQHLILYDGVCGLCNGLCQFVAKRDHRAIFCFASIQGKLGQSTLERFGEDSNLDTFYVVPDFGSHEAQGAEIVSKARAALFVARAMGGLWTLFGVFRLLPIRFLDWGYDVVARNRYRLFGRHERCLVPKSAYGDRFIEP